MKRDKNSALLNNSGFIQLIILIIIALLLMRYYGITFSGILAYFNLTWADVLNALRDSIIWFKDLFNSVAR